MSIAVQIVSTLGKCVYWWGQKHSSTGGIADLCNDRRLHACQCVSSKLVVKLDIHTVHSDVDTTCGWMVLSLSPASTLLQPIFHWQPFAKLPHTPLSVQVAVEGLIVHPTKAVATLTRQHGGTRRAIVLQI